MHCVWASGGIGISGRCTTFDSPAVVLDELNLYWAVSDTAGETLVGFVCTGAAARVPGLDADPSLIDVGVGMNPDLVGQGRGSEFGEAVLDTWRAVVPASRCAR